jgi:hypothetical protein
VESRTRSSPPARMPVSANTQYPSPPSHLLIPHSEHSRAERHANLDSTETARFRAREMMAVTQARQGQAQPHSAPLPNTLMSALSTLNASPGEWEGRKTKKDVLTSFCVHQIETCQHFEAFEQQFYAPLRWSGIIDNAEVCDALEPIRALAQMHQDLLERLKRDSDMTARDPYAKPKFCSFVHDTFFEMREPFKRYIANFDRTFLSFTNWKATNRAFSHV